MSEENTRADSVRLYLTGAASQGGAQADPDLALGGYRSSTEALLFGHTIDSPIANITVDYVSGGNSVGAGTLTAASVDTLQYTAPGGAIGPAVTIANGETKIIEDAAASAYIRVTRTSVTDLTGTATINLVHLFNNVFGFDDVLDAEQTAGDVEYRCFCLKNTSASIVKNLTAWIGTLGTQLVSALTQLSASGAGTISVSSGDYTDWPASGFCRVEDSGGTLKEIVYYGSRTTTALTIDAAGRAALGTTAAAGAATDLIYAVPGVQIATETAVSDAVQTIADEDTAPTSLTFDEGITAATGLDLGDLAAADEVFVWIERNVIAGASSSASLTNLFNFSFSAG